MPLVCNVQVGNGKLCETQNCTEHRVVPVPAGAYYPQTVWSLLSRMDADAQLETFDAEIALLRSILEELYQGTEAGGKKAISDLKEKDRYDFVLRYSHEIISAVSRRDKLLAERELLVHRSYIKKLLYDVYRILCHYIKDDAIRNKIGADLEKINIAGYRASKQIGG